MRDRGVTPSAWKVGLAAALAACGAAAIVWSIEVPPASPEAGSPMPLGILALIVGTVATLNYLYALILVRRMRRGDGIIGKWIVPPDAFDRFRKIERSRKKRKNNWRMPWKKWPAGLPVFFSTEAVLVGNTWFRLHAKGVSRFTYARIEHDEVPSVEFSMTFTVHGAGTQGQTARYRGHLRIPIADGAGVEAARVVQHFKDLLARA